MKPKIEKTIAPTIASLGYSMPAEWDTHEATWIGWPHNKTDWPDKIGTIQWVYGEIVSQDRRKRNRPHPHKLRGRSEKGPAKF